MNERTERLKILVDYLNTLSQLEGNYYNEIRAAIYSIEKELGIKQEKPRGIKIISENNGTMILDNNGLKIVGAKIDVNQKVDIEKVIETVSNEMKKRLTNL